jgi:hypothetical protein
MQLSESMVVDSLRIHITTNLLQRLTESVMETIHNHGDVTKTARAPRLAEFEIQCSQAASKRQTAFVKHFDRNSAQGFIVDDLQRQMAGLDHETFKGVRDAITKQVQIKSLTTMQGKVRRTKWKIERTH